MRDNEEKTNKSNSIKCALERFSQTQTKQLQEKKQLLSRLSPRQKKRRNLVKYYVVKQRQLIERKKRYVSKSKYFICRFRGNLPAYIWTKPNKCFSKKVRTEFFLQTYGQHRFVFPTSQANH